MAHKDDLARSVTGTLRSGAASKAILEPASPERLTLVDAVRAYRRWLRLKAAPVVGVPIRWVRALARLGDVFKLDPITTTALAQFEARLTGDAEGFETATGIRARGLSAILADRPAEAQDLWHARLYLVRPSSGCRWRRFGWFPACWAYSAIRLITRPSSRR